ncbi:MAG: cytidylate kinase, partial [Gemmatimonadetes bacterium]
QLRGPDVTARVSQVARLPEVRRWLLGVQRELGRAGSLVADGRDMGTVVFPDAEVKVFLVADLEERARRRLRQDGVADPDEAAVRAEAARIRERDRVDSEREHSPLRRPDGALEVDTTGLDFEAQVQRVLEAVAAVGR